ncbi:MAG: NAD-dependent isocitrate dehydrogenase [Acidobacteria bacterium]|nr:MAG: NAD-dependent isocitrate dehydrogenase [Acidobacteriota bacterium]
MSRTITLLPGDGIGPEVTAATVRVLEAAGADIEWESHVVGAEAVALGDDPLPQRVLDSIRANGVCLKGPVTTPVGKGFRSINVQLRQALELYANLRPVRTIPGLPGRFDDVDLIIVRENTEGLYSGIEHQVVPGVVESLKIITEKASTRVARFAFEHARQNGRKRITAVHKANIMKLSDGLFLDCFRRVAEDYPEIEADDRIIDNMCMQLVLRPEAYDVLLLENLYGDIVSDLAAGLVGGLGVVPGANVGDGVAVFEAVHGSAPDIAGRGIANPLALMRSAILMLRYLGERQIAERVAGALRQVVVHDRLYTRDLGGTASTNELTEAVVNVLRSGEVEMGRASIA